VGRASLHFSLEVQLTQDVFCFCYLASAFKKTSPDADQSRKKKKKEESLSIIAEYGQKEGKMKWKWGGV